MENQIEYAAHRLAISFADNSDIPARYKNKSDKQKKQKSDSNIEKRFSEDVGYWKQLILNMLDRIDNEVAWRFINIVPNVQPDTVSVAYNNDFINFIEYLVLRRDKENCNAEELGRLAMLSGAFQKEIEKRLKQE